MIAPLNLRAFTADVRIQTVFVAVLLVTACVYKTLSTISTRSIQFQGNLGYFPARQKIQTVTTPSYVNHTPMTKTEPIQHNAILNTKQTDIRMGTKQIGNVSLSAKHAGKTKHEHRINMFRYKTNVTTTDKRHLAASNNSKSNEQIEDAVSAYHTISVDNIEHRDEQFQNACMLNDGFGNKSRTDRRIHFSYIPKYNLGIRRVAKVGSTFVIQMVLVLDKGASKIDSNMLFSMSRLSVHTKIVDYLSRDLPVDAVKNIPTVIFARNPFSRLFSAFIDKVYILNNDELAKDVLVYSVGNNATNKTFGACVTDVSFSDFVSYVVHAQDRVLLDHYGPITDEIPLDILCQINKLFIVKQETFEEDIVYILNEIKAPQEDKALLLGNLKENRIKSTIISVVKTLFLKSNLISKRTKCVTKHILAQRLWESFQTQGFIHENSSFPSYKFNKGITRGSVISVILEEVSLNPLTPTQSAIQRHKAIVNAYKTIPDANIESILQQYELDFTIFKYNKVVPHL